MDNFHLQHEQFSGAKNPPTHTHDIPNDVTFPVWDNELNPFLLIKCALFNIRHFLCVQWRFYLACISSVSEIEGAMRCSTWGREKSRGRDNSCRKAGNTGRRRGEIGAGKQRGERYGKRAYGRNL